MRRKTMKALKNLLVLLVIGIALLSVGCQKEEPKDVSTAVAANGDVLGEGKQEFEFSVTDKSGKTESFTIRTDKEIVGDALEELDIIAGEDGPYGLYVKTVNGITADFDADGVYWAFYIDGEYATSGVDKTPVEEGKEYSFKVEK